MARQVGREGVLNAQEGDISRTQWGSRSGDVHSSVVEGLPSTREAMGLIR